MLKTTPFNIRILTKFFTIFGGFVSILTKNKGVTVVVNNFFTA